MKKIILSIICFSWCIVSNAQLLKSKDKSGKIHFFSATPMENIEAKSDVATSLIFTETDSIKFSVPITSFQFEKSLMQEHFNENYMESSKFPKASLRGKINEKIDFKKDGEHKVTATCICTIHGISKPYSLIGTISVKNNEVILKSKFDVKLTDHNIDVPKLVVKNISENIAVNVEFIYAPYVKK